MQLRVFGSYVMGVLCLSGFQELAAWDNAAGAKWRSFCSVRVLLLVARMQALLAVFPISALRHAHSVYVHIYMICMDVHTHTHTK